MEVFSAFSRGQHALTGDTTILQQTFLYLVLDITLLPEVKQAVGEERGKEQSVL